MRDWGAVGLGPSSARAAPPTARLSLAPTIILDDRVAQRFNAYATAAFPREIGGLVRVVEEGETLRVVDVKIFPHLAASGAYFELDGEAVARFNLELVRAGKAEQVAQWRGLIHSHPNMTPFLSGTDRHNVRRLAGDGLALSLICAAKRDPCENYFACHLAQGGSLAFVAQDVPLRCSRPSGTELLSRREQQRIRREVAVCLDGVSAPRRWWRRRR